MDRNSVTGSEKLDSLLKKYNMETSKLGYTKYLVNNNSVLSFRSTNDKRFRNIPNLFVNETPDLTIFEDGNIFYFIPKLEIFLTYFPCYVYNYGKNRNQININSMSYNDLQILMNEDLMLFLNSIESGKKIIENERDELYKEYWGKRGEIEFVKKKAKIFEDLKDKISFMSTSTSDQKIKISNDLKIVIKNEIRKNFFINTQILLYKGNKSFEVKKEKIFDYLQRCGTKWLSQSNHTKPPLCEKRLKDIPLYQDLEEMFNRIIESES